MGFFCLQSVILGHFRRRGWAWWRHQMKTFSATLAICAENSPVPGEFPTQRPVTRSFDVFFDLRLNKRLSKQSWGWSFETLSCPLWRHCNGVGWGGGVGGGGGGWGERKALMQHSQTARGKHMYKSCLFCFSLIYINSEMQVMSARTELTSTFICVLEGFYKDILA